MKNGPAYFPPTPNNGRLYWLPLFAAYIITVIA